MSGGGGYCSLHMGLQEVPQSSRARKASWLMAKGMPWGHRAPSSNPGSIPEPQPSAAPSPTLAIAGKWWC